MNPPNATNAAISCALLGCVMYKNVVKPYGNSCNMARYLSKRRFVSTTIQEATF